MSKIKELATAVEFGKIKKVPGLVQEAMDEGFTPLEILNHGMIDAMTVVGEKFKTGEIFVPEMLVAAKTMERGVEILKPYLIQNHEGVRGKMAIGTVYGDLHDIGKNLVIMMIESSGYEVVDLGINVPVSAFLKAADDPDTTIIGISALLTTTLDAMAKVVAALNRHPRRSQFHIMVGGAPVTAEFAKEIGADIYTADAAEASSAALRLAEEANQGK